jgi:hypothetical protein
MPVNIICGPRFRVIALTDHMGFYTLDKSGNGGRIDEHQSSTEGEMVEDEMDVSAYPMGV